MFKRMPEPALQLWFTFFNKVWGDGEYPKDWKVACVIPIPKTDKGQYDHKTYRPIRLTSHPGKLVEGMAKTRLEIYL